MWWVAREDEAGRVGKRKTEAEAGGDVLSGRACLAGAERVRESAGVIEVGRRAKRTDGRVGGPCPPEEGRPGAATPVQWT